MAFKMKRLALAVGLAAGAAGLIQTAQAVHLATDGLGQALIFPYYTTRAGWNTLINITNTSDQVVAAKVRFHEGYNSRDVFDFNIILSPHDVWNGTVTNGAGDVPMFQTSDTSCTTPAIPAAGQLFQGGGANGLLAYTGGANDNGPQTTDRMREGYITVTMMGTSAATGLAANAVHGTNRIPANCGALRNAFALNGMTIAALRGAFPGYAANPLKGAFSLVNAQNGWNASGSATTLANLFVPPVAGANLITAQLPPANVANVYADSFHEPELSAANTPGTWLALDGIPAVFPNAGGTDGANAVSEVLRRNSVINQWANRIPAAGATGWEVRSDWVVTFPTKRFYVDGATHEFSGRAAGHVGLPAGVAPVAPFSQAFAGIAPNARSCDNVSFTLYDREEQQIIQVGEPVFSPAPTPQGNALCTEVSVLTFGAAANATQTNVLGSPMPNGIAGNVPAANLPGENGWMQLDFTNAARWLPVTGFAVIDRTDPNGGLNEAFIVENAYLRSAAAP